MKKISLFIFFLFSSLGNLFAQPYSLYSNDTLTIASEYLQKSIHLNFHLPETHAFSASTTAYPITIVFDSQHDRTYPQIINSFDLLTSETQIPESIIVGVPFNLQNRRYLTSAEYKSEDHLSGIERMDLFLFQELIPKLQKDFKANDFIVLIGHSRTAFLVNYLAFQRSSQVNLAISLSGFFDDDPLSIQNFYNFLTNETNFPKAFNYYYSAGTSLEEANYLKQLRTLNQLLQEAKLPQNVNIKFYETPNANHITNYWVSLPPILIDAFSSYNTILDTWFHEKLAMESKHLSVEDFKADLAEVSNTIGVNLNPNLTHIYSLASHFAYQDKAYQKAVAFIEMGLSYYPDYLELYFDAIAFYKELNNFKKIQILKKELLKKAKSSQYLSEVEKQEIISYVAED